ncbi:Cyclin-dependent kinase-like 2 [Schistosoma japonicum]|nr:Cyclin-dependent kinase-like 2 [Schistosoma japonicum]
MRVPFAREIDPLDKRLSKVSKSTLGFIKSCLRIDASDRPTSSTLLRSEYFTRDNFASIFLEELKTLIKNETELYLPSSSINNTVENKSVNIASFTSQVKVKNDPPCKNNNIIDNSISNPVQLKACTTTTLITGTTTSSTSTNKLSLPDSMNVKQQNYKLTTMNLDHSGLPITPQAAQNLPEVNENKNTLKISNDLSTNISCSTKSMQVEDSKPKCIITEEVNLRCELSTPSVVEKSELCSEHIVHQEHMDPHHLLDVMNISKNHHGSDNVLNKNDDLDSRELLPVVEKMNDRLNEMPSIPQKSFGLLTTIKCQSPKPMNSILKSSVLEDSSELLNDTDPSSVTLPISPLHATNITSSESSLSAINQPLSTSGLVTKIQAAEVPNEHTDCTSTVTETSVSKYSDSKSGDSQPKEMTSNKRLPYLTLTQTNNYHFLPQHHRGIYQTPPKSLVSDQINTYNTTTVSSGIGSSPLSPLLTYNQHFNKHENLPNFQSTNISASTCIQSQTWTTQISSSSVSNSSKDSKGRRYYQPPNPHRRPTFSLQFPMNIGHAVCQSVSTSIGNHYNSNHSHHFSVLQPIGIMPSPNIFDTNHEHSEQSDLRSFIGQVNFSTRSPLQNLSQQNIFKKSFTSTTTTGTTKLDSTCSLTGNQHSLTPQILPAFTYSTYSANQYGANVKSNPTSQFPMSRLSKPDSKSKK